MYNKILRKFILKSIYMYIHIYMYILLDHHIFLRRFFLIISKKKLNKLYSSLIYILKLDNH